MVVVEKFKSAAKRQFLKGETGVTQAMQLSAVRQGEEVLTLTLSLDNGREQLGQSRVSSLKVRLQMVQIQLMDILGPPLLLGFWFDPLSISMLLKKFNRVGTSSPA